MFARLRSKFTMDEAKGSTAAVVLFQSWSTETVTAIKLFGYCRGSWNAEFLTKTAV